MRTGLRVAPLSAPHRSRLAEIVRATGAFRDAEVDVAIELFDEAYGTAGTRESGPGTTPQVCHPEGSGGSPVRTGDPPVAPLPRDATPGPESRARGPDYVFLGAFDDADALVGYACYGPTPGTDGTHDLYWIAVDPAAQGAGAGSALLGEVERRLREAGARLLVVETSGRADYGATRAFYRARDYAEAARVRDFYAPADDRVVFTKRLRAAPKAVPARPTVETRHVSPQPPAHGRGVA